MGYVKVYSKWLPYAQMKDQRGFISLRYGASHTGVDSVGNEYGNPVCAVFRGTVTVSRFDSSLGNVVEIESGALRMAFYHLAQRKVVVGDAVEAGVTVVGIEGSTGSLSTGKHLHTSLWIGRVLTDPEPYLSGERKFPVVEEKEGVNTMAKKVIRADLNLRTGAGATNPSYGYIRAGSLLNPTETVVVSGAVWGKTAAVLANGTVKIGWCNLGDTWSQPYAGAISPTESLLDAEKKIAEVKKILEG